MLAKVMLHKMDISKKRWLRMVAILKIFILPYFNEIWYRATDFEPNMSQ